MNILNLSSVDYGGAGDVAIQYSSFYKSLGHNSCLIVKDQKTLHNVLVYKRAFAHKVIVRLFKILLNRIKFDSKYHFYNTYELIPTISITQLLKLCPFKPDVIILYWISDFINTKAISKLQKLTGAKIVWHMTDNGPLTGGCHYPWQCNGFKKKCKNCPAITSGFGSFLARLNLRQKNKYLPSEIMLITYSPFDYSRAKNSILFKNKEIIKLLGFVDQDLYRPDNKSVMKKYWKISSSKKVIFFGASNIQDTRKGYSILKTALDGLDNDNVILLIAGSKGNLSFNKEYKEVGLLDENELIKAFQAADLYVCPSLEDSGPMMINQSIMCGTPVVSFNMGVAPDLVHTGLTGYMCSKMTSEELLKGILYIITLNEKEYNLLSENCREFALSEISLEKAKSNIDDWMSKLNHR